MTEQETPAEVEDLPKPRRDRIAQPCILLACGLLVADLALALFRLAPFLGGWVRHSPEMVILTGALVLLLAAMVIRHG